MAFKFPEQYRIKPPHIMGSVSGNGVFVLPLTNGVKMICIASDGLGWEHVSTRAVDNGQDEIPTWEEMCAVKSFFWDAEDWVIQYHPAESEYVNNNHYVLHLWRPVLVAFPTPPSDLVGIKKARL